MEPSYETVVDPSTMIFTMAAYVLHGVFAGTQAVLSVYLIVTGSRAFLADAAARTSAALRVAAGLALALPILAGAPFAVSLTGGAIALVLFLRSEPGWVRRLAIPATALLLVFMLWEREDPLGLGVELTANMQRVRAEEVEWQLAADRKAPKVGELAPDFSLEDPSGRKQVQLSDFRGKRPVALMFGSYT